MITRSTGSAYLNERPKSPAAADKEFELDIDRLIQAPALLGPCYFRGVGFLAEEHQGRIAGRGVNQQEQ